MKKIYKNICQLIEILGKKHGAQQLRILIVRGNRSYKNLENTGQFKEFVNQHFCHEVQEFSVNPKFCEGMVIAENIKDINLDYIIAIGGGSVIDMAKILIALLLHEGDKSLLLESKLKLKKRKTCFIAVPTTAGTGTEATHFAVAYKNNKKYSIADRQLVPDCTVLDGSLCKGNSSYQRACTALDAMSQAIESIWAKNSTSESSKIAFAALELIYPNIIPFVTESFNANVYQLMLEGAHLAGKAINISKTTSAHAFSYGFTTHAGIPHGHAVWLTLPKIFELHYKKIIAAKDRSHFAYYKILKLVKFFNIKIDNDNFTQFFQTFLKKLSFVEKDICCPQITNENLQKIMMNVNQERLRNNPVEFTNDDLDEIYSVFKCKKDS